MKIQDMTAAAVVVSAMDKGSNSDRNSAATYTSSSSGSDISSSYNNDAGLSKSQTVNKPDAVDYQNPMQNNNADDDEDRQALDGLTEEFVSEMTEELNELMGKLNCDLEFQYHKEVDIMSVKMVNKETKEVIKEYPPEDMIKGMMKAREWLGAFLDKEA